MRRLTILAALILSFTLSVDAAIMAVVTQVFSDNSCRTFAWYPDRNCHGDPTIWCDPTQSTCEALTASWSIPPCDAATGDGNGEEDVQNP